MSKLSIKSTSRILAIAASLAYAGNVMAQVSVHVNANKSCMLWLFNNTDINTQYYCEGKTPLTNRGSCTINMPAGKYQFAYGGHGGFDIRVWSDGTVKYQRTPPKEKGLIFGSNTIQFDTLPITLKENGFPGTFSIEGEVVTDSCSDAPKNTIHITRGANFKVNGEWPNSPSGHVTGGSMFRVEKGMLESAWVGDHAFSGDRAKNSISPNPNYWLKAPTPEREVPINRNMIVVSKGACPTGYKVWNRAKGRFLLAEGWYYHDDNREYIKAKIGRRRDKEDLGGEARHKLLPDEAGPHKHESIGFVKLRPENKGNARFGRPEKGDHYSYDKPTLTKPAGGGDPHNNIPPYIAVNFCEAE